MSIYSALTLYHSIISYCLFFIFFSVCTIQATPHSLQVDAYHTTEAYCTVLFGVNDKATTPSQEEICRDLETGDDKVWRTLKPLHRPYLFVIASIFGNAPGLFEGT